MRVAELKQKKNNMSNIFRKPSDEEVLGILKNARTGAGRLEPTDLLDRAIVGITGDGRIVYSENRILLAFQEDGDLEFEDALEQYEKATSSIPKECYWPPVILVYEH